MGTGNYDGGYFFEGELLLLDLESGTATSLIEDGPGRQVLGLEWLDDQRLRVLTAPPDDWDDEDAWTEGHIAVVRRADWRAVPPRSVPRTRSWPAHGWRPRARTAGSTPAGRSPG
ncbi:hypothetical protein [Streptomyces sp. 11x1]|uniref:hypothetical protein n=1 Tax=Streptomyces sp. 11x1 TaxID=3038642 RepID=UPI00292DF1BA|nr:hypothetical protein [Streptomyces sp. 11x1]WNZ08031.1 hypothetical protein P8T65_10820 [Streptomyces sp. 11x1]